MSERGSDRKTEEIAEMIVSKVERKRKKKEKKKEGRGRGSREI